MKKIYLLIIALVILALLLLSCSKRTTTNTETTRSTPEDIGASSQITPSPPALVPSWRTTHTYTGNGNYQTDTITVSNTWKIEWNCKYDGAPLYVIVHSADKQSLTSFSEVSTICKSTPTTGDTVEHTGGSLYLEVISGIDWNISVLELK